MSNVHSSRPEPREQPPEAWAPLFRFALIAGKPLERFLRIEAASGIVLLAAAAVALLWANSPWAASYHSLWHASIGAHVGPFVLHRSLEWFVNDVLMVVFFFVVGLEIRREIQKGELSELRRAALPVVAALGGMVAPACVYLVFAGEPSARQGWGVPMATDIAFALGVLALLGRRAPPALRVLLLALAVIDDLGAILVIALFYSSGIAWQGLAVALLGVGGILLLQLLGARSKAAYLAPGVVVWAGIYAAGVHPTIAGVLIGFLTPTRAWLGAHGFSQRVEEQVQQITSTSEMSSHDLAHALKNVSHARREALSPAESLIEALHPWVAFVIMPVFALANAGVSLGGADIGEHRSIFLGATAGLVLGKPLGVVLACVAATRTGLAKLPRGLGLRHVLVLGVVAGIGFTMALFVAQLAFDDAARLGSAKLGVLVGSSVAVALTLGLALLLLPRTPAPGGATSADEAEASTEL